MTPLTIVTDVEGTTSSIDFVHQTLFPYARAALPAFLAMHGEEPEVAEQLNEVARIEGRRLSIEELGEVLQRWIDEDRKATPLKELQGRIWAVGYAAGALTGHVYPDVPGVLEEWHQRGIALYIYSSGSVEAQKLIFGHTEFGDLTPLFSGYFDTRVGAKREADSYRRIADSIGVAPAGILFLSDIGAELDAASLAGMQTCQLIRDEKTVTASGHRSASSFADLNLPV